MQPPSHTFAASSSRNSDVLTAPGLPRRHYFSKEIKAYQILTLCASCFKSVGKAGSCANCNVAMHHRSNSHSPEWKDSK